MRCYLGLEYVSHQLYLKMMDSRTPEQPLIATITYCLSETGRERSIKQGGSGAYHQNVSGPILPEDLAIFDRTPDGEITLVFNVVEFHGLQPFSNVLKYVRERHRRRSAIKALMEAEGIAQSAFGDQKE